RQGPVRARILANKGDDNQVSVTEWLNGAHESIAMHPEWRQLRRHLQGLAKSALPRLIDGANAHTVEAIRQVTGEALMFGSSTSGDQGTVEGIFGEGILRLEERPELLHQPFMVEEGAISLRRQALARMAHELDVEAESQKTLDGPEYRAFEELVRSVYIGSLQKRVNNQEGTPRQERTGPKDKPEATGSDVGSNGDIAAALVAVAVGEGFDFCLPEDGDLLRKSGVDAPLRGWGDMDGGQAESMLEYLSEGSPRTDPDGIDRVPGLGWLDDHILGRSIPMRLRRELWCRKLFDGGPSASQIEAKVVRLAGEKGIADPTNTPIASIVTTGVRHCAGEVFPRLALEQEQDLRNRVCGRAEQLLNQYFVFSGRHEARYISMALVLAYVFDGGIPVGREDSRRGGGGGSGISGGVLVGMLHCLATAIVPGVAELMQGLRDRAYEEIKRRDPELHAHLSVVFPGVTCLSATEDNYLHQGPVECWLEDALIGSLREDALLFVWDHLFLLGWKEELPLFVADLVVHLRSTTLPVTAPLALLSLAKEACRKVCTRQVREAYKARKKKKRERRTSQEA
ncbi:unnamed protein product, partial [Discosporangium mesarthrocarpum]